MNKVNETLTRAMIALSYIALSMVLVLYYRAVPPSPDQSLYDYIAWQGLHGVQWYAGSFDVTWPGNLIIAELGIRIFGIHPWTARLTDFLLLQPGMLGIYWFLRSANLRAAAIAALFVYPILYVTAGYWTAGHRDIVAMHFLIGAGALVVWRPKPVASLFFAGSLIGYAVLLRPTYLAFCPFLLIPVWARLNESYVRQLFTAALLIGAGLLLFPVLMVIAGVLTGTIGDWFKDGVQFVLTTYRKNLPYSRLIGRFFVVMRDHFFWMSIISGACVTFWFRQRVLVHTTLIAGLVLTCIVSFVVQNQGFGYHLAGLLPLMIITSLGGINLALPHGPHSLTFSPASIVASVASLVIFAGTAKRVQNSIVEFPKMIADNGRADTLREAVAIVKDESGPTDRIYQWGWNYAFSFRSQRLSISKYVDTPLFSELMPNDYFGDWLTNFDKELDRPVKFILIDLTTLPDGYSLKNGIITLPEHSSAGLAILINHLNGKFSVRSKWKDAVLFMRNDL